MIENSEINSGFLYNQTGDFVDDQSVNLKTTVGDFLEIMPPNFEYLPSKTNEVQLIPIHEKAQLPVQATEEAACSDIHSVQNIYIGPGETVLVSTGLKVAHIPIGFKIEVYSRSGLASKGIQVGNGVGQIDSDYRGEIKVIVYNSTKESFNFYIGDRIAQIALVRVEPVYFSFVESGTETKRSDGGFGSTGS